MCVSQWFVNSRLARLRNMPDPPPSPFPPGISPMPAVPGSVNTPTTMQQANWQVTPNLIPLVIDAIRGVKNLIFLAAPKAVPAHTHYRHKKNPFRHAIILLEKMAITHRQGHLAA